MPALDAATLARALPVLRAPEVARRQPDILHVEVPGNRVSAMPWAALEVGGRLVTRAEVAATGVELRPLVAAAMANLEGTRTAWSVVASTGGFLGFGKKPVVVALTGPFAVEQLLLAGVVEEARALLRGPATPGGPSITMFAPKRGEVRAVCRPEPGESTGELDRARAAAIATWNAAGEHAVCPAELGLSFTVGNAFHVGPRFAGEDRAYAPPVENVCAMVVPDHHVTRLKLTAPRRPLLGDLGLYLGVRDPNGAQTLLPREVLQTLGLSVETSLEPLVAAIPLAPVLEMGSLGRAPVLGFRGERAIDQLASVRSMARLHDRLGDRFFVFPYSHVRVGATRADVPRDRTMLRELIELIDPRQPGTILTRGRPEARVFVVERGELRDVVPLV